MPEPHIPADKLRDRIDRGDAHDKVEATDPAAAPLGTDEETAGAPPGPEERDRAFEEETARRSNLPHPPGLARHLGRANVMLALGGALALTLVLLTLL